MEAARVALTAAGIDHDVAWSAVMCPDGGVLFDHVLPSRYTHLVFVCGPAHGQQVRELHDRFVNCRRIAVGVSVVDRADPAVNGFHVVLPRDAGGAALHVDLAAGQRTATVPLVGVVLAHEQPEYGDRQRHASVNGALTGWLRDQDIARVPVDTRLDPRDWRMFATPGQAESLFRRLDAVVTTRLHGLVLALKHGVPALAVDPVAGGGKVGAQAGAWRWPAVIAANDFAPAVADRHWAWCLSAPGRRAARQRSGTVVTGSWLDELLAVLTSAG
jgi:hypothetical protein